ncbi:MAG TPA: PaaI family thioesterase [Mycobacterium sp.]|uniref:PaaI family thioesterase n=1 Tax=Mycobacterium sp. TaxID=1785 RepID=UPI002BC1A5F5|nr:PaaI family thioesterase [Mycobacterium sp.]HXO79083.1 PaaI family thioesterase [Mycobacterium sp.]
MTQVDKQTNEHDLETPDSIQVRFGIAYVESRPAEAVAALSMPMDRFRNPFNGAPTVGPLAILVDAAAGIVNHYRRRPGQWTVSSELSMDLSLDGVGHLDGPVLATAHAFGPLGATSLGICTLTYRGMVIGGGTVRSFFIDAEDVVPQRRSETLRRSAETTFADLIAAHVVDRDPGPVLVQRVDGNLNNDIDIVHGGVAAAGLELAASAAVNRDRTDDLLQTASLRVNFLRPFFAGSASRYEGTPLRVGRNTAVSDAQAIGDDGKVAITARVTAYR